MFNVVEVCDFYTIFLLESLKTSQRGLSLRDRNNIN